MNKARQLILPAEWAPQSAVMLTWPHLGGYWDDILLDADQTFAQIAKHVADFENVVITCQSGEHLQHIQHLLHRVHANLANLRFAIAPSDDAWVRDHGPITVLNEDEPLLLDFVFNSWGGKYACEDDNALTRYLFAQGVFGDTAMESINLVLEGGSIETDGVGTLLTTRSCLLSPKRNPTLSEEQITSTLQHLLGVERILWLEHGALQGDDTDGHIDTLARFCDPRTICYVECEDTQDENFAALQEMKKELAHFKNYQNHPYRLVALPSPQPIYSRFDGRRLPATYANFLIINNAVLLPVYDDPNDYIAASRIASCFPKRKVIPINCKILLENFGSLHCVTMQLPVGVIK